jgi:hypothetical protein
MFDSKLLYLLQTLLISGALALTVRREARVLQVQLLAWSLGVIGIMWRYNPNGQLGFYSNDQLQYAAVTRILMNWDWAGEVPTLFWWTDFSKFPYPAAAVPLALAGVHIDLALKTVSIICLLALSRQLLLRYSDTSLARQTRTLYLTGCGLIGTFFSLLALRETMMMYLVYRYVITRSVTEKLATLVIVFLLRSHLAVAIVFAEAVITLWVWVTKKRSAGFADPILLIVAGVTIGYTLFNLRFNRTQGYGLARQLQTPFTGNFGMAETSQIASNFAGLQFLTTHEAFVKLSVSELLLLRVVFSDTVLIPLGFTVACLVFGNRLRRAHRFTLLLFAIYVSIVTNTDFNSFRQNIPLMPLMGMVILDFLKDRELQRSASQEKLSDSSVESPVSTGGAIPSRIS